MGNYKRRENERVRETDRQRQREVLGFERPVNCTRSPHDGERDEEVGDGGGGDGGREGSWILMSVQLHTVTS